MKTFALLLSGLAGFFVIVGCNNDTHHHEDHSNASCDAVAIGNDGLIHALVNKVDNGFLSPGSRLDDSPPPPSYSSHVSYFEPLNGHAQGGCSLPQNDPYVPQEMFGLKLMVGGHTLLAGFASGIASFVLDSNCAILEARLTHGNSDYFYSMHCAPVSDGLVCVYQTTATYLAWFDESGNLTAEFQVFDERESVLDVIGLADGNAVIVRPQRAIEFDRSGQEVWSAESSPNRFSVAGEDAQGRLMLFGVGSVHSVYNLIIATRVEGMLQVQGFPIGDPLVTVGAVTRGADSTWFLACHARPDNREALMLLRYDGVDSVVVTDRWFPGGEPHPTCAATAEDGWIVLGGSWEAGTYDTKGFLRAYSATGMAVWMNEF